MAYVRRLADGTLRELPFGSVPLGDFGWSVRTPVSPEGHEQITRGAIGPARSIAFTVGGRPVSVTLTAAEFDAVIAGNRSVDLGWHGTGTAFAFKEAEQRRHSLRRNYNQPIRNALADIVSSLRAQHGGILAEPNPMERMRRVGKALHLVQDSFSPAHTTRRSGSAWCIEYIRNYGRGGLPIVGSDREHRVPSDERDKIARSGPSATQATSASRQYLRIVFKAIYGQTKRDPTAIREAAAEFDRFVATILRLC